jgi:hypothetical protein
VTVKAHSYYYYYYYGYFWRTQSNKTPHLKYNNNFMHREGQNRYRNFPLTLSTLHFTFSLSPVTMLPFITQFMKATRKSSSVEFGGKAKSNIKKDESLCMMVSGLCLCFVQDQTFKVTNAVIITIMHRAEQLPSNILSFQSLVYISSGA